MYCKLTYVGVAGWQRKSPMSTTQRVCPRAAVQRNKSRSRLAPERYMTSHAHGTMWRSCLLLLHNLTHTLHNENIYNILQVIAYRKIQYSFYNRSRSPLYNKFAVN